MSSGEDFRPGDAPPDDGPPPFLRRWRNVYIALVIAQAVIVGLLALLTVTASR